MGSLQKGVKFQKKTGKLSVVLGLLAGSYFIVHHGGLEFDLF